MTEQKLEKTLLQHIEDHTACAAYAEVNEPCPIDLGAGREKRSLEDDLACVAYHELGEDCPIRQRKQ